MNMTTTKMEPKLQLEKKTPNQREQPYTRLFNGQKTKINSHDQQEHKICKRCLPIAPKSSDDLKRQPLVQPSLASFSLFLLLSGFPVSSSTPHKIFALLPAYQFWRALVRLFGSQWDFFQSSVEALVFFCFYVLSSSGASPHRKLLGNFCPHPTWWSLFSIPPLPLLVWVTGIPTL